MGCPADFPAAAPAPAAAPVATTPADKLKAAQDALDAAKKAAADKKTAAESKKKEAATKKAAAEAKKKVAMATIDSLVAKASTTKGKLQIKVLAAAAAAGVKLTQVEATLTAANDTEACATFCSKAKVDCVNDVLCEAEVPSARRHLLATFDTTLYVNPDAVKVDVTANLKAAGVTPIVASVDPAAMMDSALASVLSTADLAQLKTDTSASGTAAKASVAAPAPGPTDDEHHVDASEMEMVREYYKKMIAADDAQDDWVGLCKLNPFDPLRLKVKVSNP